MAVIGMSTIRCEADILSETFPAWAEALDLLLVADCGSTDNSVELIEEWAGRCPNIVFLGAIGPHHARQVRRHIWEWFRRHLSSRDWWIIADGDEFIEEGFRSKLKRAEAELADHLFSAHVNFYYSRQDHDGWEAGRETLADRARPIAERRRHYQMHTTQRRAFRHLPWLRWNDDTSFPERLSVPSTERIVFRHYQYRDPEQMKARIAIRRSHDPSSAVMKENPHWAREDYRDAISEDPKLILWEPGQEFVPSGDLARPRPKQPLLKTLGKYALAMAEGAVVRRPATPMFANIDPREALRRAGQRKVATPARNPVAATAR